MESWQYPPVLYDAIAEARGLCAELRRSRIELKDVVEDSLAARFRSRRRLAAANALARSRLSSGSQDSGDSVHSE
jgi:hypothetical protein